MDGLLDPVEVLGGQDLAPELVLGHVPLDEAPHQPVQVDPDLLGRGGRAEPVGGDVGDAVGLGPAVDVPPGQGEQAPHDLAEHRAQVAAGVLGVVQLGPEHALADAEALAQGDRGHPDVDPEAGHVGAPHLLAGPVGGQPAREAEVAADRLAQPPPVQGGGQREGDRVGDGAVQLVPGVQRGDQVVAVLQDRPDQPVDPGRADRAQVGVQHRAAPGPDGRGQLEDGPEGRALAGQADIGHGQLVRALDLGVEQQQLLVAVGGGGHGRLDRAVGRVAVRDGDQAAAVGEVLAQPGLHGTDDVADRPGVLERRDADEHVDGSVAVQQGRGIIAEHAVRQALQGWSPL
ncbi:MAG TPA: hypothetical protein VG499_00450 [Actinomycetota bacterium]|nr:hypothetical protein [Actinomycetota bacterium]